MSARIGVSLFLSLSISLFLSLFLALSLILSLSRALSVSTSQSTLPFLFLFFCPCAWFFLRCPPTAATAPLHQNTALHFTTSGMEGVGLGWVEGGAGGSEEKNSGRIL